VPEPDDVNAAVGRNVRGHRTRMAWTLDDLAARSGVSKGMLSQIEQARTNPSVATICRLATALGVSVASLVEAPEVPSARVVRAEEAVTLWTGDQQGSAARLLVGSGTSQQVELWDVRMEPGDGYASEAHPGPGSSCWSSRASSPWNWTGSPTGSGPGTRSPSWPTGPTPTATRTAPPCATP
jgi:transcriptional regulator with XRE-family HTH domain